MNEEPLGDAPTPFERRVYIGDKSEDDIVGPVGSLYRELVDVNEPDREPNLNMETYASVDAYSLNVEDGRSHVYHAGGNFLSLFGTTAPVRLDVLAAFTGLEHREFRRHIRLVYGCCPRENPVRVSVSTLFVGEYIVDFHKRMTFSVPFLGVERYVSLELRQRPLELLSRAGHYILELEG